MEDNKKYGISVMDIFLVLLAIVFITLKLCKVIAWSWLWVLSPIWIPIAIALAALAIFGIILFFESLSKEIKKEQ